MKKVISLILILFFGLPVFADYQFKEIPVNNIDLDNISDSYQITVSKGHYTIKNALTKDEVKKKLQSEYKTHKLFIIATLEIFATLFCPVLVPALQEAANMQDYDNKVGTGETTIILVPVNAQPILEKE